MKKTIKQIADEIGVSKQAIQQRIKKEPLTTNLQPYISIVGGTKYIDIDGVNLIKSAYLKQEASNIAGNIPIKQPPSTDNELHTALLKTIEILQEQLKVKDEQILNLTNLTKNAQLLHATEKPQLIDVQQKLIKSDRKPNSKKWKPFWKKGM